MKKFVASALRASVLTKSSSARLLAPSSCMRRANPTNSLAGSNRNLHSNFYLRSSSSNEEAVEDKENDSTGRPPSISDLDNNTLVKYMDNRKHFIRVSTEDVEELIRTKYSDCLMKPPTLCNDYPFALKSSPPPSPSNKPLVSPINPEEYFAVVDKILARAEQRGNPVTKIGVAVSGGGDSLGTALLMKQWASYRKNKGGDIDLYAIVVDHQIRPEAEHEMVYTHKILKNAGFKEDNIHCYKVFWSEGEKMNQRIARSKRQLIINTECISEDFDMVVTGHHKQDNIETIIHRIAFSSGINGLNGIPIIYMYRIGEKEVVLARPGLVFDQNELKAVCLKYGVKWVDDPTNSDEGEFRGVIRKRQDVLYKSGITPTNFYNLLLTLGAVRNIMLRESLNFFNRYVRFDDEYGFAGIYFYSLDKTAEFIATNVLNSLIQYVTNRDFPVTLSSLKNVVRVLPTTKRSLGGCLLVPDKKILYVIRDTGNMRKKKKHVTIRFHDNGIIWDNRFFIQIFQYNKLETPETNITYSKKLSLERQPEYDNIHIPDYAGKVDTNPLGVYKIRPFTEADFKYFSEHYPLMIKTTKNFPTFLTRTFPVIEDEKGILAVPFLGWKRCVNIFWLVKFIPSHQKFVLGEADSLYDFVKLFSKKNQ